MLLLSAPLGTTRLNSSQPQNADQSRPQGIRDEAQGCYAAHVHPQAKIDFNDLQSSLCATNGTENTDAEKLTESPDRAAKRFSIRVVENVSKPTTNKKVSFKTEFLGNVNAPILTANMMISGK